MQLSHDEMVTYFAETDARNKRTKFGIKAKDRTRHVYVIGKTGMGKSTLLENMAVQDIKNGEGMAFIDPHGKTADLLLEYIPENRLKDVVYFAPFDLEFPVSFNVLESVDPDKRHLVVSGLMSTFKKIWVDAWSARMEYILTNTLLALLEYPEATLLGVNRMLSDKAFRNKVISHITDPAVKSFWVDEFANYTERQAAEAVPAIQNKIGQFTANPLIRNMIGQPKSSFNIREMMDSRKIMIINLSKGRVGETNANLLGGMLITKIYLAAMSRADVSDRALKLLPNFYLFVDEFQNFANESFADILSEARKYKLNLTIAHQYIEQMEEEVAAAVFGNVGTMIVFRVGATDAEYLEKEFAPVFTIEDIVNLGFAQIYLKLMIDGVSSQPFSAKTLGPIPQPAQAFVQEVIAASRSQFAQPRADVEKAIADWMQPINPPRGGAKGGGPANTNGVAAGAAAAGVASALAGAAGAGAVTGAAGSGSVGAVSTKTASNGVATNNAVTQKTSPAANSKSTNTSGEVSQKPATAPKMAPKGSSPALSSLLQKIVETVPKATYEPKNTSVAPANKPVNQPAQNTIRVSTQNATQRAPVATPAHKPFANAGLGDLLKKVAPIPTTTPAIKPISLSELAQKAQATQISKNNQGATSGAGFVSANNKPNPKIQTPDNVNNLKAALAAAMKKPPEAQIPTPTAADRVVKSEQSAQPNQPTQLTPEVPRDVLEKVLKLD